ncbi:MAG: class I SAM-dependent methyltransferase, partial [bacterium]
LFDPLAFVTACRDQLTPGGLLVLTCPNGLGFDVATLGEVADTVTPEHLNYFNPQSLALLMQRGGLELLEVFTPGKLDAEIVRKKVLAGQFALDGQPFLQRVLFDEWEQLGEPFQRFLADNGLSSHQWLVARRPDISQEETR